MQWMANSPATARIPSRGFIKNLIIVNLYVVRFLFQAVTQNAILSKNYSKQAIQKK